MLDNMYDMYRQYISENPEESKMWKQHVAEVLSETSMRHPGASLTNVMLETMIDDVMKRTGMDSVETAGIMDMADDSAVEVFAPHFDGRHHHNRPGHRFPTRFFPRDFARFLLLSQLLG